MSTGARGSIDTSARPAKEGILPVPLVSFVGISGSGKTTLLEAVIAELRSRGYRVAAVKHAHHDFTMDHAGKDTWRLAQAGCAAVAISSPDKFALIERRQTELPLADVRALVADGAHIVLAEGYKDQDVEKVLVLGPQQRRCDCGASGAVVAVVQAHKVPGGKPRFNKDDIAAITELLVARIAWWQRHQGRRGRVTTSSVESDQRADCH